MAILLSLSLGKWSEGEEKEERERERGRGLVGNSLITENSDSRFSSRTTAAYFSIVDGHRL